MDSPEVIERVRVGLALVDRIARRFDRALDGSIEGEDLAGYGRIGLLAAARAFDPNRGLSFAAYAAIRIRGAIWDAARAEAAMRLRGVSAEHLPSQEFGAAHSRGIRKLSERLAETSPLGTLGVVLEVTSQEDGEFAVTYADPEQELSEAQFAAFVVRCIQDLSHEEAELVRRHCLEHERIDRVGQDLGISKSWASRMLGRAIKRLRKQARRLSRPG